MISYRERTDNDLFHLLKEGNHAAYEEIYKRYWAILFRHARRILQNDEESKDIIQDIFTMLWVKSADIALTSNLSSFLYASVRNRVLDLIDKNKVRSNYLLILENEINSDRVSIEHEMHEKELARIIEKEISLLPPKMREIFELSRKAELPYKEIADQLAISENTVKKQISNALKILRSKLEVITPIFYFFQIWIKH
ncbi:RNA polymerase sigma factor [Solitalea lacus]|uniref:RNA polymerase sigma factor n=1 Tax=Solitalea lacus TaxID=2911172 RepID=UPI001EDB1260|nr:RNA polymerase sigma-70 factor [Solitalea lacus]UKJ06808.1 RNA polymerase sigma-70 factor [Solitalea lacus]